MSVMRFGIRQRDSESDLHLNETEHNRHVPFGRGLVIVFADGLDVGTRWVAKVRIFRVLDTAVLWPEHESGSGDIDKDDDDLNSDMESHLCFGSRVLNAGAVV